MVKGNEGKCRIGRQNREHHPVAERDACNCLSEPIPGAGGDEPSRFNGVKVNERPADKSVGK